jgi:hypothetical protein
MNDYLKKQMNDYLKKWGLGLLVLVTVPLWLALLIIVTILNIPAMIGQWIEDEDIFGRFKK